MIPILRVEGATVSYGPHKAIDGVCLTVPTGSTLGLVGESGSGKTTLARVIAGILEPDYGKVFLDGEALGPRRSRSQRKRVQMVFQNPDASLNPRLTVRRHLSEALRFHRVAAPDLVEARCVELLGLVRLEPDALSRYPHEFSGGQRQRIAIARALSVEPELLIADEPTSALDVSVQLSVLELLRGLKERLGLTMLFISHDLGVINAVSDAVALMRGGSIVELQPRRDFFSAPKTAYGRELLSAVPRMPAYAARAARVPGEAIG